MELPYRFNSPKHIALQRIREFLVCDNDVRVYDHNFHLDVYLLKVSTRGKDSTRARRYPGMNSTELDCNLRILPGTSLETVMTTTVLAMGLVNISAAINLVSLYENYKHPKHTLHATTPPKPYACVLNTALMGSGLF